MVQRLQQAGQHKPGDADILIVFDAGYDVTRLAFLLADLPVELLGPAQTTTQPKPDAITLTDTSRYGTARHARGTGCTLG